MVHVKADDPYIEPLGRSLSVTRSSTFARIVNTVVESPLALVPKDKFYSRIVARKSSPIISELCGGKNSSKLLIIKIKPLVFLKCITK